MITFKIILNCILNDTAWDQSPQWEKRQKTGSNRKNITLLHLYFLVNSVSDNVCALLLQTISLLVVKCD